MTTSQIIEQSKNPVHSGNNFVQDVVSKLQRYGAISARQMECLIQAMNRDIVRSNERKQKDIENPRGESPVGRSEVTGTVLSTKWKGGEESGFGAVLKMLVELENRSKVWCSVPRGCDESIKGCRISVKATWTQSPTDKCFSFGTRPVVVILEAAPPVQPISMEQQMEQLASSAGIKPTTVQEEAAVEKAEARSAFMSLVDSISDQPRVGEESID